MILPSRPENVAVIRQALAGAIEVLGLSESRLLDINTAVSEACNNVVVHAYEGERGPARGLPVRAGLRARGHRSRQRRGYSPKAPEPGLEVQGLGLSLIQTLSDRVEFLGGINQGTEVRMAFSLNGESESWIRDMPPRRRRIRRPPGELVIARLRRAAGGTGARSRDRDARRAGGLLARGHLRGTARHRFARRQRAAGDRGQPTSSSGSTHPRRSLSSASGRCRRAVRTGSWMPPRWASCRRCWSASPRTIRSRARRAARSCASRSSTPTRG